MRWAAVMVLAAILATGCRKQEKDIEALSREAVEDEVTAVLDSLERETAARRTDTVAATATPPPAVGQAPIDIVVPAASEPIADTAATVPLAATPETTPAPAPETEPAEQGKTGWVVQVGIYAEYAAADRAAEAFKRDGLPAFVRRVDKDGKTFYRLRIGVYDSQEEAKGVGETLKARHGLDYWIASNR